MPFHVELFEAGREPRVVEVDGPVELAGQQLRLEPGASGLVVTDLSGGHAGTTVNGHPLTGAVSCAEGDWLLAGGAQLRVHAGPAVRAAVDPAPATAPAAPTTTPAASTAVAPVAAAVASGASGASGGGGAGDDGLVGIEAAGVARVRYRPGSPGAQVAKRLLGRIRRARKRLSGFGSEATGLVPTFVLTDPVPDPDEPGRLITEGTMVDAATATVYVVVTAEAPPEPPERALALLFGHDLPGGEALEPLLEGYGLWLAETPDPGPQLRTMDVPPLHAAEGEVRAALALSFVLFLVAREGEDGLRRFLTEATSDTADDVAQQVYGLGLAALERAWRTQLDEDEAPVKTGQFLRLSLRYLRPHKWKQAEIFLYMLFALAFSMVFPFVTRALFDTALLGGDHSLIAPLLIALAAAAVVSLVAGLRQAYLSAWVSSAVIRDLRATMFAKLQRLPVAWYHRHQQGDVLTRLFSDVHIVESGLTSTLRDGIFQLLSMVVSAVVMLALNPPLGILVLLGAPLVAVVYRRMSDGARTRGLAVQEDTAALMGVAAENYQAGPVVKLFALQDREIGRFDQLSNRLFRSERRLSLFGGLFGLSVNSIVTVLRLAVLAIGSWMIVDDRFTVGGLVAFLGIMGEVLAPVTVLTGIGQQIQAASGSLHRIEEITDEADEFPDAPDAVELGPLGSELRLADVEFGYTPDRPALDGVTAAIPAGRRVAFVGASGSGKSTLLQLVMRLYDPDGGAITWDGVDLRAATTASLRSQLGVVFQESFLFDTTVKENIALGRLGATDEEVLAAARAAEVDAFVSALPQGYDTAVGERGGMLSGGQRQRIAIARALVRNPRVLLLDEATSALDPKTERQITETLNRVAVGRTTIAITHRLTSVTDYDRIFVMDGGHLVEQGTHEELVAAAGVYARLWSEQTGQPLGVAGLASAAVTAGGPAAAPTPVPAGSTAVAPATVPTGMAEALGRVALFAGLDGAGLADVAGRLSRVELPVGESVADGDALWFLTSGEGRVMVPGLGGSWSTSAELGAGDVFGLAAVLAGAPTGAWFQALERCELAVLTGDDLDALSHRHPAVAAARSSVRPVVVPEGARRLTRVTRVLTAEDLAAVRIGPAGVAAAAPGPEPAVREDEVAASRVYPRLRA